MKTVKATKVGGTRKPMPQVISWILYFIILAVAYWFLLPPLNWRSGAMWTFIIFALILRICMSGMNRIREFLSSMTASRRKGVDIDASGVKEKFKGAFAGAGKVVAAFAGAIVAILLFMIIASVSGWEIFHASAYSKLLVSTDGDFSADVAELSMNNIPVVDRDTAERLGLRKIGEMSDLVSQFEVDDFYYTQINYKGEPCRVTPLMYGDFFKWMNNHNEGIPAYVTVNMVTQETQLVRLADGIKYSDSEYFFRNLTRHLRFKYPTKIFDNISFELDEDGTPYWIASTVSFRIGIWSGRDINGAVLCNAVTGECEYYDIDEIPTWVDQVYNADMLIEQLTFNGEYQSGFFNSIFGQKGVIAPTDGYNYIALNDDVYLYTGITSVASDESNIGFVLVNLRTKETKYYACPGAEEYSAMDSAEGVVQDLQYTSTFPLLLNVSDRPTYFVSLKDSAGLVKMYAFIDVQRYQIVGTGSNIKEARTNYAAKLTSDNIDNNKTPAETKTVTGTVADISSAVVNSNTHYYIMLEGDENVYIVSITQNDKLPFVKKGDKVEIEYTLSGDTLSVTAFDLAK